MKQELTKAEVKAELEEKKASIQQRINALEGEATTAQTTAQERANSLFARVKEQPLLSIGGVALAGLVLGYLMSGRSKRSRRRRRKKLRTSHAALIEEYLDALSQDVRHAISTGEEADWAVRDALRDRVPLVVHRADGFEGSSSGTLRQGLDLFVKTAFSLLVRYAIDALATQYLPSDSPARSTMARDEASGDGGGMAAVASAVSESEKQQ